MFPCHVLFGCCVWFLCLFVVFRLHSPVLCSVVAFVHFLEAICSGDLFTSFWSCFVRLFRSSIPSRRSGALSASFFRMFYWGVCSDVLFESSVLCFVRVFCRGGGACFVRWFCSGVDAFVVFCSDVFLIRPLKCFVRVRGLKTSVRALHHTLCSEHEN